MVTLYIMIAINLPLVLQTSIVREKNNFFITYTIRNDSEKLVYLTNLNVRSTDEKGAVPDPSVVEIFPEKDKLHISKRKPVDPSDRFYTPKPYYVTPLPPGDTFRETVSLPLPILLMAPEIKEKKKREWLKFDKIYFSCGYFIGNEFIEAKEKTVAGKRVFVLAATDRIKNLQPDEKVPPAEELYITSGIITVEKPVEVVIDTPGK